MNQSLRKNSCIYLDYAATTPCLPEVVAAMAPYWSEKFGNPASQLHSYGWQSKAALDQATSRIAAVLNTDAKQLVFTSGASESIQIFLFSLVETLWREAGQRAVHALSSPLEHNAVVKTLKKLSDLGWLELEMVKSLPDGRIDFADLQLKTRPETKLISVMAVNNELGSFNPIDQISQWCSARDIFFHTDATQAMGKFPIPLHHWPITALSFSSHKFQGPKGVGGLFVRRPWLQNLSNWSFGGGQDHGFRSGTQAVPLVVGMAEALDHASLSLEKNWQHVSGLGARLLDHLRAKKILFRLNGPAWEGCEWNSSTSPSLPTRTPYVMNLTFDDQPIDLRLSSLAGLAFSVGSACHGVDFSMSHVLRGLGLSQNEARSTLRLSFGAPSTLAEIDAAAEILTSAFAKAP